MRPSKGRIVLYCSNDKVRAEHPAIITRVFSDDEVNLMVFFDDGQPLARTHVRHLPDDPDACEDFAAYWRWPERS